MHMASRGSPVSLVRSASSPAQPGQSGRPSGPVALGRPGRTRAQLVAVRGQDQGPSVAGPAQDDERAHRSTSAGAAATKGEGSLDPVALAPSRSGAYI